MGKPSSQPQSSINHCSHPHPLHISNPQPHQSISLPPCSACKLTLSAAGPIYTCITCNYHLHLKCSQTPHQITHPFHQKHPLNLLPTPSYPSGFFNCDACGKQGNGFSYHCKLCEIDLHSTCSSMPLIITNPHHNHQLSLVFSSPYPNNSFSCDICKTIGSSQWLYRCNSCGFDCHLTCATTSPDRGHALGIPSIPISPVSQIYGDIFGGTMARNYAEEQATMIQMLQNIRNNATAHTNQDIYQAILGGMAGGAAGAGGGNPYLQSQSILGGGGAAGGTGGNAVLNALMGGGGGGGGGGNPVLNALMSGGGGGNPMLNALMGGNSGAGGGGNPVLNALMGGGGGGGANDLLNAMAGGGGGGLDFSALGGALGGMGGFGF